MGFLDRQTLYPVTKSTTTSPNTNLLGPIVFTFYYTFVIINRTAGKERAVYKSEEEAVTSLLGRLLHEGVDRPVTVVSLEKMPRGSDRYRGTATQHLMGHERQVGFLVFTTGCGEKSQDPPFEAWQAAISYTSPNGRNTHFLRVSTTRDSHAEIITEVDPPASFPAELAALGQG
jgi:hypothetical protein